MTTGMKLPSSVTTMLKILDSHSLLHRKISVSWLIQDGGTIGTLISLNEKMFRRYVLLRSRLNDILPDDAGLNFSRERGNFCKTYYLDSNTKQISDHILINKFLSLDLLTCYEVSRKLGGNLFQIFEDAIVFDKLIESNLIK
uniref:Cleavage and polyadenylation specificity factor subunit 1 (Trinotate prediction) n=1 Tax=Myxobolus squamalis TaxID=59785 RepID=A0A6B2G000_MYXSQ